MIQKGQNFRRLHRPTLHHGNHSTYLQYHITPAWRCLIIYKSPREACSLISLQLVQVKKQQQAVVGFLEANRISFHEVDITMLEEQRLWMYRNIPPEKRPEKGNPLPPQIFNEDHYCGDYEDFFHSKENNTVFAFLGLSSGPSVKDYQS
ncbi:SH3 domain-binding glutamic acid-rich-like protein 2 [Thalassophryne amazonica]|uniref:SH3 domain-binding glutamic acid-rich-like protein 2 n=1 Tax=Thalassophryne amazonica TaxID=390379 RepID=UPI001470B894|nr:SH3 domain-binding glutamic acid-rich-like protein 2 [Thalassophryne amazonica]